MTLNSGEESAILSLLPPYAQDPSFPPVSSPCPQTGPGPLTIFWVLPIATLPQHGLTGVAAEAVPMKETAFGTEAFQDIEVFPTECTQVPGTSLHRPPDHRVSWSPGQLQRSSLSLKHSFLPSPGLCRQGALSHLLVLGWGCRGYATIWGRWLLNTGAVSFYLRR